MKIKSMLYKLIIKCFKVVPNPIRHFLFKIWKKSGIPFHKFYKDLKFKGLINIKIKNKVFFMQANGGTIENEIFWKGLYNSLEPETIWIFEKIIDKGIKNIIDIGANTGLYSLLSNALNPNIKIIAFEPSVQIYEQLIKNIQSNKFPIVAEKIGISNISGTLDFFDYDDENQTNASISPLMSKAVKNKTLTKYTINTVTLDDYVNIHQLNSVDFIKIDVELYEPEVFAGMKNTILTFEPFIVFEVLIDEIAEKLNTFFENEIKEYLIFEFKEKKQTYYLSRVQKLKGRPDGNWNYFACHKDKFNLISDLTFQ